MVRSAEERRRILEEENAQPYMFGFTWGEFHSLPQRQQQKLYQRLTQYGTSHVGFWKTCDLGKCRRAKRCCGFLTEAQYAQSYNDAYPPCVGESEERRQEAFDALCKLFPDPEEETPKYNGRPGEFGG